jgi:heme/copper-type cytochrome/quinol oxidase subunit 3
MTVNGMLAAAGAYDWSRTVRIAVLGIPTVGMLACSLVASVLAVLALRKGDRSLVLLWPLLLGAAVVLFLVGEFAFPH